MDESITNLSISSVILGALIACIFESLKLYYTNFYNRKKTFSGSGLSKELSEQQLFSTPAFNKQDPYAILVGVGPGDTNLLTVAALKVLSEAELVLSDRLVSDEIFTLLRNINPNCKIHLSSKCKKPSNANVAQKQLNDWLVEGMENNLNVCRLKGGDPFVFGRGMEEIERVLFAGYKIKVIPGISSGFSAPLSVGISVTKRNVSNKVMVATAHGQFDTYPDMPQFREDCTLIFLMGVSRLPSLMESLTQKGFDLDTPVCVIERATTEKQQNVIGCIKNIVEKCNEKQVRPPATIVVGNVCRNDELRSGHVTKYIKGGVVFFPSK